MADHGLAQGGHPAMDYAEHERTYRAFVSFAKWGTGAVIVVLILMAIFLL
ncbi:aa3-type cytochrome c oxidase subunit IV [Alsobacter sp. SYSU M60028]|uniref:Aa3-type cytochrome c oxidase subunit IV n=1 Tax=Alsobacter ponti TaxID=2962936 RepID=A0ABT1LFY1_9HYPH|nr:aa3-type cytochrome c oxidase subunit IV [Alsobacter ponti]MCP8939803.1 aa3-type cytochrome c oxidase subunit IV [Alsobacter ponti]